MQKGTANMMVKTVNITKRFSIGICLLVSVWIFGFTPFASAEKPPENILKNGDFDLKLDGWHHWTHADAAALFQTEGKKAEPIAGKKRCLHQNQQGRRAVAHPILSATLHVGERHHLYL